MRCGPYILLFATATPLLAQERPAAPLGLPAEMPALFPIAPTSAAAALGRQLFFDRQLSRDGTIACASCHDPQLGFADGRAVSTGVDGRVGTRNSPTIVNRGYGRTQFWDGRVTSLLEQVMHPIENADEMAMTRTSAVDKVAANKQYRAAFRKVFDDDVNETTLARALASYVATILSGDSPFDRYEAGDTLALSAEARQGRALFFGRANCMICHRGPNLTDEAFHTTGVAWRNGAPVDSGRFTVTRRPAHIGAFKTPTLREVARTAPYMHDGSIATLEEVVEFYDRGGIPSPVVLRPLVRPLQLTAEEKVALVAFLRSLSGTVREGGW